LRRRPISHPGAAFHAQSKEADRLVVVNKCSAVIVTLAEVSDSDEADSDREAHGVPDSRFSGMLTAGNASMNGWLVLEAICLGDVVNNPEAMDACGSFKKNYPKTGPAKNIVFPARGGRVVVIGERPRRPAFQLGGDPRDQLCLPHP
jgi:hypothetical protein